MALKFLDGFGYARTLASGVAQFNKYDYQANFLQAQMIDGPSGHGTCYALNLFNTAFDGYALTRVVGASETWYVGFALTESAPLGEENVFLRFECGPSLVNSQVSNPNTQLVVTMAPDGIMRFYQWIGSGGMLGTNPTKGLQCIMTIAPPPLTYGVDIGVDGHGNRQWTYVEIKAVFGTVGSIEVHYNDVLVGTWTGPLDNPTGLGAPDRLTYYWERFGTYGLAITNLYIADGADDSIGSHQNFLGPVRCTTHLVSSDQSTHWHRNTLLNDYACVNENPCDGDSTNIEGNLNEFEYFGLPRIPCFGRILGVSLCATGRLKASGTTAPTALLVRDRHTTVTLQAPTNWPDNPHNTGPFHGSGPEYTIMQSAPTEYSVFNTTSRWTAGEIEGLQWGLFAPGPDTARVSQVWVEIMTSLRNNPYSCGGLGSYAF